MGFLSTVLGVVRTAPTDLSGRAPAGNVSEVSRAVRFGAAASAALVLLSGCSGSGEPDRAVLVGEALADETVPRAWAAAPSDGAT